MKKTKICLVRHGETDWNIEGRLQGHEDIPMNSNGIAQSAEVGIKLSGHKWDKIISSPLNRAIETARIIGAHVGIEEPEIMDSLIERSYGEAAGLLPTERRERFPNGIPGQEEFDALRERGERSIESIAARYMGCNVIVVSHGGLINSILYTVSGGEIGSFKTRLFNSSINLLERDENGWTLLFHNLTASDVILENYIDYK